MSVPATCDFWLGAHTYNYCLVCCAFICPSFCFVAFCHVWPDSLVGVGHMSFPSFNHLEGDCLNLRCPQRLPEVKLICHRVGPLSRVITSMPVTSGHLLQTPEQTSHQTKLPARPAGKPASPQIMSVKGTNSPCVRSIHSYNDVMKTFIFGYEKAGFLKNTDLMILCVNRCRGITY